MGEGRAEPRTAYAVLYAPTTEGRRTQRGATERSEFKKYFSFSLLTSRAILLQGVSDALRFEVGLYLLRSSLNRFHE